MKCVVYTMTCHEVEVDDKFADLIDTPDVNKQDELITVLRAEIPGLKTYEDEEIFHGDHVLQAVSDIELNAMLEWGPK